ncbi:hypothetical protein T552_00837 [Pneumocystis carinii B80]|uniref:Vacuolar ATPase assembly protein VMA22 n=1 Tax=Pneumocystis carinii (strain B80) TaxID=1408658 RepID=A0A0W4ZPS7_PNEC8|nr:hypothetical protein T552_00837 [Pneumocystis carinii B80]KTW30364.1 hypothetical protein T552_00837 [Pneumocystis carinii B80]
MSRKGIEVKYRNIYEKNIELIELKKINKVEETSRIDIEEEISMNPLYWYGILVPQELKEAQQYFKEGLEKIIEIINLSFVIRNLEKEIVCYRKEIYPRKV